MKVLLVPAVKEKVWKETDDASKKEMMSSEAEDLRDSTRIPGHRTYIA